MHKHFRVWAELDRAALVSNAIRARKNTSALVMAVVKADAYGHGLKFAASALAPHVDAFAIATLEEGVALRQLFRDKLICCLSGFHHAAQVKQLKTCRITPVIYNHTQIQWLEAGTKFTRPVWLKIDTGMGRLGFKPDELEMAVLRLKSIGCEISLMSHFASADRPNSAFNAQQHERFLASVGGEIRWRSFANSAAILSRPQDHFDVIRPGIMLYGSSPFADQSAASLGLQPVMRLFAKLLDIKQLQAGETVGYGATWCAPADSTIGIVSIGYGDGYPRGLSEGAQVAIEGRRFDIIGRVSMDTLAIRLDASSQISVGTTVELWGETIAIDEVAGWANTISYELLCKITARVERISI